LSAPVLSVRVRLIADLRGYLPADAQDGVCTLSFAPGAAVRDVLARLGLPEPGAYVVLLNGRDARLDDLLREGDQVAAFPRLAGG
jgi:molybdopterin synthase sulfur carrier subunit